MVHPGIQHALSESCGLKSAGADVTLFSRLAFSGEGGAGWHQKLAEHLPARVIACGGIDVHTIQLSLELVNILAHRHLPLRCWRRLNSVLHEHFEKEIAPLVAGYDVVISFDTASQVLFERLSSRRPRPLCILEASIGHPAAGRELLNAAERYPQWASTLDIPMADWAVQAATKEAGLADLVVTGSSWAAKTYVDQNIPESKIFVNCYGCKFETAGEEESERSGLLFCGTPSLRKGLPDLLEALTMAGYDQELHIAGGSLPRGVSLETRPTIVMHGRLIPSELRRLMRRVRAVVLPTYLEGLSLILAEALSQGCAVVTTANSGIGTLLDNCPEASDRVILVPPGAPERLARAIVDVEHLAIGTPLRVRMPSWTDYGRRLLSRIDRL